jgi:hypothetical protein
MCFVQIRDRRLLLRLFVGEVLAAMVAVTGPAWAESPIRKLEDNVVAARHGTIQPLRSDANIGGLALACDRAEGRPILQLHVYLTDSGPFLPNNASPERLKDFPGAEISIDDRTFMVGVFFSERYVILADDTDRYPRLSDELATALLTGRTMILRFDLVEESLSRPARFDTEAAFDLSGDALGLSIGAVSQCIERPMA